MDGADTGWKLPTHSRRRDCHEIPEECYRGLDLAPSTLESLVTWDVSGHARREQERLSLAHRTSRATRGGY